jgi:hypothetical protein
MSNGNFVILDEDDEEKGVEFQIDENGEFEAEHEEFLNTKPEPKSRYFFYFLLTDEEKRTKTKEEIQNLNKTFLDNMKEFVLDNMLNDEYTKSKTNPTKGIDKPEKRAEAITTDFLVDYVMKNKLFGYDVNSDKVEMFNKFMSDKTIFRKKIKDGSEIHKLTLKAYQDKTGEDLSGGTSFDDLSIYDSNGNHIVGIDTKLREAEKGNPRLSVITSFKSAIDDKERKDNFYIEFKTYNDTVNDVNIKFIDYNKATESKGDFTSNALNKTLEDNELMTLNELINIIKKKSKENKFVDKFIKNFDKLKQNIRNQYNKDDLINRYEVMLHERKDIYLQTEKKSSDEKVMGLIDEIINYKTKEELQEEKKQLMGQLLKEKMKVERKESQKRIRQITGQAKKREREQEKEIKRLSEIIRKQASELKKKTDENVILAIRLQNSISSSVNGDIVNNQLHKLKNESMKWSEKIIDDYMFGEPIFSDIGITRERIQQIAEEINDITDKLVVLERDVY